MITVQHKRLLEKLDPETWKTAEEIGIPAAVRTICALAKLGLVEIDTTEFDRVYSDHVHTIPNPAEYLKFRLKKQE